VTEAGVNVTFKPTNSIYSFYRLAGIDDIARLGPVSFAAVQHTGRDTGDYPAGEIQATRPLNRRRRRCDRMKVMMEMKARNGRSVAMLHF
jgi:hypothetical protein